MVERHAAEANAVAAAVHLEESLNRNDNVVVQRLAEYAALRFTDADHAERPALNLDRLAHRIHARETTLAYVVADEDHRLTPLVVGIGQEAAVYGLYILNNADVGSGALKLHPVDALMRAGDAGRAVSLHAKLAHHGRALADEVVLFLRQLRVALLHLHVFLGVKLPNHDDAAYLEAFRTHIGEVLRDVNVHAVDDAHHRDERGGGQDDPQ